MGSEGGMAVPLRVVLGVLGVAGILLGLFLIAVASFADGSTGERVVTITIALGIAALGVILLRSSRSR
jgi:hypothetical protein